MKMQCVKWLQSKDMKLKMLLKQREQIFHVNLRNWSLENVQTESKKELLSELQHVRNTDLHLKLIDLDPNRGILILFILPWTGKVHRNKNTFFFGFLALNLKSKSVIFSCDSDYS